MTEVRVFDLPTKDAPTKLIEEKLVELMCKHRKHEDLDEVELSWMDSANNWLQFI